MISDADRRLAEVAAAQHAVFTNSDARRAGLTHAQIDWRAAERWTRLYDGVFRVRGAPPTWRGELLAATLAAGDGAAISHQSAAALYELPTGRRDLVELSCRRWRRTVCPGLVVHESRRLDPRDIRQVDGIPVTSPERLVLDIASIYPNANYLEYVVQAARRKRLITFESTETIFLRHARRGLKGVAALRELLERWDPSSRPTDSDMETMLLHAFRAHGLPEPILQYEVFDTDGQFVARPDAAYPSARIAIEYDSKQEHSDEFQIAHDDHRRNALQAAEWSVLVARHADVRAGGAVLCAQIRRKLRRALEPA